MIKNTILVIAILADVALASVWLQHRKENERTITALQTDLEFTKKAASDRSKEDADKIKTLEAQLRTSRAAEPVREANSAPAAKPSSKAKKPDPRTDPAYARILEKEQIRNVNRQFGAALAQLNLPPEKLQKLRELLAARANAAKDARDVGQRQGLEGDDLKAAVSAAVDEVNRELVDLIGQDHLTSLIQAQKANETATMLRDQVGPEFESTGVPLTSAQWEQLTNLYLESMKASSGSTHLSLNIEPVDPKTGLTPTYERMLAKASGFLSPNQIPVIKQYFTDQVEQQNYFTSHNK
jgi:hypothetical protein